MNDTMNGNQDAPATETPHPPADDLREKLQSDRNSARLRHGKIAALPPKIRRELNFRLERGQRGPALLDWLNALPKVIRSLKENFDGQPITKQNLSAWRQGGYVEWQMRQELAEAAGSLSHTTQEVTKTLPNRALADNLATMVAAQYARLLNRWDGEPDPKFEAKLHVLRRLSRDVVQLQKSIHQAALQNIEVQQVRDRRGQAN